MRVSWFGIAVLAIVAALGSAPPLAGSERTQLPDFELTRLDGSVFQSSTELPSHGKWLILYVQPNCRPCDKLMSLLKKKEHAAVLAKMVIVAGGVTGDGATAMRQKLTDLSDARWFADPSRKAWTALHLSGTPMVFGVRDKTVEWSLGGVLPSDHGLSTLSSWVAE